MDAHVSHCISWAHSQAITEIHQCDSKIGRHVDGIQSPVRVAFEGMRS